MTPSASEAGLAGMGSDQRQVQMVEGWKAFKRVFQEGVALFNQKPKKGIAYLQVRASIGWEMYRDQVCDKQTTVVVVPLGSHNLRKVS